MSPVWATLCLVVACATVSALPSKSSHSSLSSDAGVPDTTCTPPQKIEGIPADIKCLEQYVRSKETTCPKAKQSRTVQKEYMTPVPGQPGKTKCQPPYKIPAQISAKVGVVCHKNENAGKAPAYPDQTEWNLKTKGSLTPSQALRNAKPVMDRRQYYSQCERDDYHRLDCVGLVARAWHLRIDQVWTTGDLKGLGNVIKCEDLQTGDILNSAPHVMLFHHWIVKPTKMLVWQAADYTIGHIESEEDVPSLVKKGYTCLRYKFMNASGSSASGSGAGGSSGASSKGSSGAR